MESDTVVDISELVRHAKFASCRIQHMCAETANLYHKTGASLALSSLNPMN